MKSLEEAWQWYMETRHLLRVTGRLADRFWNDLDWEGALGRDEVLRTVEGPPLVNAVDLCRSQLDDLAIVALFSVFESVVRDRLRIEIEEERQKIKMLSSDCGLRGRLRDDPTAHLCRSPW